MTTTPLPTMTTTTFRPMLAGEYRQRKAAVRGALAAGEAVYVQPKLDGIRCIATAAGLFTREGARILSMPHIEAALKATFAAYPDMILDGELYHHYAGVSGIKALVMRSEPHQNHWSIEFHAFDMPSTRDAFGFGLRYDAMLRIVLTGGPIQIVETHRVSGDEAIRGWYSRFLDAGYEGTMIRLDRPYLAGKRSVNLLKLKP